MKKERDFPSFLNGQYLRALWDYYYAKHLVINSNDPSEFRIIMDGPLRRLKEAGANLKEMRDKAAEVKAIGQ